MRRISQHAIECLLFSALLHQLDDESHAVAVGKGERFLEEDWSLVENLGACGSGQGFFLHGVDQRGIAGDGVARWSDGVLKHHGLGLALLHHAFGEFYRRGTYKVGLGVDSQNLTGATRLYERAGMHIARQYIGYEKELRTGVELSTQAIEE